MDKKLAKELKDNGFLLRFCRSRKECNHKGFEHPNNHVFYHYPTLSELIEACRKTYMEDGKIYSFGLLWSIDKWFAGFTDEHDCPTPELSNGEGSTPEEAVAELWLSLQAASAPNNP